MARARRVKRRGRVRWSHSSSASRSAAADCTSAAAQQLWWDYGGTLCTSNTSGHRSGSSGLERRLEVNEGVNGERKERQGRTHGTGRSEALYFCYIMLEMTARLAQAAALSRSINKTEKDLALQCSSSGTIACSASVSM